MRILITGHTGFIGQALLQRLADEGHDVVGLSDDETRIDIRDEPAVQRAIDAARPDVVHHLAGVSGPMLFTDEPEKVIDINCAGTLAVFRAAVNAGVRRVVYGASVSSYASAVDGRACADSIYGVTKHFGELLALHYSSATSTEFTSVRIGSVYGEGRETFNPVHEMVRSAVREGEISYNTEQREPMIWIRDCVDMLVAIGKLPSVAPTYDAVTELLTHREMAELIGSRFGASITSHTGAHWWYPQGFDELRSAKHGLVPEPLLVTDAIPHIAGLV
ncbi:hypothetical protein GCM10025768_27520 [Microbacterium pseudoresistens]|uniref:Nucleoside-diphosphate-sugar epimerase n=1 Tax=Microbacterium pseudoresistens TaxID=640634 RepID=A0A7Y9JMU4_9MICO|nr:NAD(P)-dependent oxidoreductase [Microbacterium pseudoresistens]NYD54715.1 nucleoside-diphosphate-sugar epimerase [Microbacterium pseudoresistens]